MQSLRETTKVCRTVKLSLQQFESKRYLPYCAKAGKDAEAKRLKTNKCENKICIPPPPPPKPGFWQRFFSCDDDTEKMAARPPAVTCRKRIASKQINPPDLSFIDGQPFRTCGEAYVIQKDLLPIKPSETSRETRLIKKIEQPLHCVLDPIEDPLDKVTKAELRLIILHDKKLHPSYKQLDTIPKECHPDCPAHPPENPRIYNTISGPLDPNDIPIQLKFNKDLLEKKNIMCDFKRVEPPRALIAPIIEMRKNHRPTLEKRRRHESESEMHEKMENMATKRHGISTRTKSASFDTLQQGSTLLDSMLEMSGKKKEETETKKKE